MIVERPDAPLQGCSEATPSNYGIPVMTSAEAAWGGLNAFVRPQRDGARAKSAIRAGPYEERLNPDGTLDWAFIVHEKARGWILDAICREIGSRQPASWKVVYYPAPTPEAKNYFFSHHALFESFVEREADRLKDSKVFVWYTHPRVETPASVAKLLLAFDQHVTKVIFTCESNRQVWIERGLAEEKTAVILGAADPSCSGSTSAATESSACRPLSTSGRTPTPAGGDEAPSPSRVPAAWPQMEPVCAVRRDEGAAQLHLQERSLSRISATIYSTFDVFLSISNLEGGPIPLVEAMMSNAVPVASRTGFAPDLIQHGENGFIFDLDASRRNHRRDDRVPPSICLAISGRRSSI